MAISCAYCKKTHETAAEVRACWQQQDHENPSLAGHTPSLAEPESPPKPPAHSQRSNDGILRPGPARLGRNLVLNHGQPVPPPWDGAERITIDTNSVSAPTDLIAELRRRAHNRERCVFILEPSTSALLASDLDTSNHPEASSTSDEPYTLGPEFGFPLDEIRYLIWENAIDLRNPEQPQWPLLTAAVTNGARLTVDPSVGDITLPNGEPAWLDGGPLTRWSPIEQAAVLPAINVHHGHLIVAASAPAVGDAPPVGPSQAPADDQALAPDQQAAVWHQGGAARIIAPAGSGKTRVLTARARYLLNDWHLSPQAVSLVAFNKRAQVEIAARTSDLPHLQVRTLNAIALAITNGNPPFARQPRRWTTIDEPAVRSIISDLVSFPRRRNSDPVAPWIEALSLVRLGLVTPADVEQRFGGEVDGFAGVWPQYRAELERRGAVDFDDQIYRALHVLLQQPAARAQAQRVSQVMLVDEFQDLTPAHVLLIRLLAAPAGNVFGVGDDDQTIYGYNGADPKWLIQFDQLFPHASAHPLEVNYRCPAGVVDIADRLLRHNRRRVKKVIRPGPGREDVGWEVVNSDDPVGATVATIQKALTTTPTPAAPREIAVLTRVNSLLAPVQVALAEANIAISGGVGSDYLQRTVIRSALAWLRLAAADATGTRTPFRAADLREALLRPSRSFHPRITDWVCEQDSIDGLRRLAGRLNNEKDAARLVEFADDIHQLQNLLTRGATTQRLVTTLQETIGLAGAVSTLDAHRHGMNRAAQGDDLTALTHLAALQPDARKFESWLQKHLAVPRSTDGVVLATVHRVKGQEWPHVIVHLADHDQYPHRLAEDTEEERRLFHVAITRAQTNAVIVTGTRPSRFVAELTTEPDPNAPALADAPKPRDRRVSPIPKTKTIRAERSDPTDDLDATEFARYETLCDLRHELRNGKPAYVVFNNRTAAAIAKAAPTTLAELPEIPGMGPAKINKYGQAIIDALVE